MAATIVASKPHMATLRYLYGHTATHGEHCVGFKPISRELAYPVEEVRKYVRFLAKHGYAAFFRGLMDDEGKCAGSGYCITPKGQRYVEKHPMDMAVVMRTSLRERTRDSIAQQFLSWRLPPTVCADLCATDPKFEAKYPGHRAGTNLLSFVEAQQMVDALFHEHIEALISTTTSLVAAVSLLRRAPASIAPSKKMLMQMIKDYENAIEKSRKAMGTSNAK